jgi:HlyD family secretion protein
MNATTVQNVVTYNSVIEFENPQTRLFPGMTAYVTIPIASADNVVKIPNGAMRFKPDLKPEELRALLQKYGFHGPPTEGGEAGTVAAASRRLAGGDQAGGGGERRGGGKAQDVSMVWKLRPDKTLEPARIKTGITDHTTSQLVQVIKGELNEGDELVIGSSSANRQTSTTRPLGQTGGRPPVR